MTQQTMLHVQGTRCKIFLIIRVSNKAQLFLNHLTSSQQIVNITTQKSKKILVH
jgi:hypothetical protein